jgi:hypothetical protein
VLGYFDGGDPAECKVAQVRVICRVFQLLNASSVERNGENSQQYTLARHEQVMDSIEDSRGCETTFSEMAVKKNGLYRSSAPCTSLFGLVPLNTLVSPLYPRPKIPCVVRQINCHVKMLIRMQWPYCVDTIADPGGFVDKPNFLLSYLHAAHSDSIEANDTSQKLAISIRDIEVFVGEAFERLGLALVETGRAESAS